MAREAIARLYDVDDNSLTYQKPDVKGKYDIGSISFRAKRDKLIDLGQIHESVWATRLSGGTRSALVSLDVTVIGSVTYENGTAKLLEPTTRKAFLLSSERTAEATARLRKLHSSVENGERLLTVSGRLEGWKGHWPKFLNKPPPKTLRLIVTDFSLTRRVKARK